MIENKVHDLRTPVGALTCEVSLRLEHVEPSVRFMVNDRAPAIVTVIIGSVLGNSQICFWEHAAFRAFIAKLVEFEKQLPAPAPEQEAA